MQTANVAYVTHREVSVPHENSSYSTYRARIRELAGQNYTTMPDRPSSADLIAHHFTSTPGQPRPRALLAFSRGKDAIAAALALRAAGVDIYPFYRWVGPKLPYVERDLARWDEWFGRRIIRVPSPHFWRQLDNMVFQPAHRADTIEAAGIAAADYFELNRWIRAEFGIPEDTWAVDGVRAADTPNRRRALTVYGPVNEKERLIHLVWDWRISHVRAAIADAGVDLPPDYQWFKRTFDGLHHQYTGQLAKHSPADYEVMRAWFPLLPAEQMRYRLSRPVPNVSAKDM